MRITNQIQNYKPNNINKPNYQHVSIPVDRFEHANKASQPAFGAVKIPTVSKVLEHLFPSRKYARKTYLFSSGQQEHLLLQLEKKPELGNKPILFHGFDDQSEVMPDFLIKRFGVSAGSPVKWSNYAMPMDDQGKVYSQIVGGIVPFNKYHYSIYYKDTGIWDDNFGKGYTIESPNNIKNKILSWDKRAHFQPSSRIIRGGQATGNLVFANTLESLLKTNPNLNEPIIAVVEDFGASLTLPNQLKGLIVTKASRNALEHETAFLATSVDLMGALYDERIIKKLRSLNGKHISMELGQKGIRFKQINQKSVRRTEAVRAKIELPEIETSKRFLSTSEYTRNLVGPKAFNLKLLEDMKKHGKLQDVEIPKSFAIPCGVYDEILVANPEKATQLDELLSEAGVLKNSEDVDDKLREVYRLIKSMDVPESLQSDLVKFKDELGLGNCLMIRSAFNGEDVKGYSAAGLYDSFRNSGDSRVLGAKPYFDTVKSVMASKYSPNAYASRVALGIEDSAIRPTVIVQDYVNAEYRFTLYTKDPESVGKNKIQIEMHAPLKLYDVDEPYLIKYDKDTDEVQIESIARKGRKITLDDKFRVIYAEPINDPVMNDLEKWKVVLKKLCRSAMEVEKEFGSPQDIEGGINLGENASIDNAKLYLWQTRDQVF